MKGRAAAVAVALALGLGGLSACGEAAVTTTAAEQVPALSAGLARVDAAVAAHRYTLARRELRALITATTAARDDGRLSAARAESILAASARMLAALPDAAPAPKPTPKPSPEPTPTPKVATQRPKAPEHHRDEHHRDHKHRGD